MEWIAAQRTVHLLDELTTIRRDLHAHPETAFEEQRTAALMLRAMTATVGADKVDADLPPTMGAEDFGWMLARCPGAYGVIGNGTEGSHGAGLHSPGYDFNDAVIPTGVAFWVSLVNAFFRERNAG